MRYVAKCFVERDMESKVARLRTFANRYGALSMTMKSLSLPRFNERKQLLVIMEFDNDDGAVELLTWFGGKFFHYRRFKHPIPHRAICRWSREHGNPLNTAHDVWLALKYFDFRNALFKLLPDDSLKVEADFGDYSTATDFAAIYPHGEVKRIRSRGVFDLIQI